MKLAQRQAVALVMPEMWNPKEREWHVHISVPLLPSEQHILSVNYSLRSGAFRRPTTTIVSLSKKKKKNPRKTAQFLSNCTAFLQTALRKCIQNCLTSMSDAYSPGATHCRGIIYITKLMILIKEREKVECARRL